MKVKINGRKYGEFNQDVSKMKIEEQIHHYMFDEFEAEPVYRAWKQQLLNPEGTLFFADGIDYYVRMNKEKDTLEISARRA